MHFKDKAIKPFCYLCERGMRVRDQKWQQGRTAEKDGDFHRLKTPETQGEVEQLRM